VLQVDFGHLQNHGNESQTRCVAYSGYYSRFKYRVGTTVRPDYFTPHADVVCGAGIHFFYDRADAEEYCP
jgi:hypothetical protein